MTTAEYVDTLKSAEAALIEAADLLREAARLAPRESTAERWRGWAVPVEAAGFEARRVVGSTTHGNGD